MKTLWASKKNVVARSIQQKGTSETIDFSSPSKMDSGTLGSLKIIPDPALQPTLLPSSSVKPTSCPPPSVTKLNPKKCKTLGSESIYEQGFDSLVWSEKHIFPHSFINMDDVTIKSHLQLLAQGGV
ncbi:hypothetical protein AHAS_Ahas20G0239900 [Arachis hypogaea]